MDDNQIKHDNRLTYIAKDAKQSLTKGQIFQIANQFRHNIKLDNNSSTSNQKCVNIYKNLARDIRMHFIQQFYRFLGEHNICIKQKMLAEAFYPFLIRAFVMNYIDPKLMVLLHQPQESQNINSEVKYIDKGKLYFIVGAYIVSKLAINSISINKKQLVSKFLSNKYTTLNKKEALNNIVKLNNKM